MSPVPKLSNRIDFLQFIRLSMLLHEKQKNPHSNNGHTQRNGSFWWSKVEKTREDKERENENGVAKGRDLGSGQKMV